MSDSHSSEDECVSNKELLRRLNKLERKYKKAKRQDRHYRNRSHSRRNNRDHRSLRDSRSPYIAHRTRSPGSHVWKSRSRSRSPRRVDLGDNANYRSPRGSEFREDSGDRVSHNPATAALAIDARHSPGAMDTNSANLQLDNGNEVVANSPVLEILNNEEISEEFLEILGDDPEKKETSSFSMHTALGNRWGHIIKNGMMPGEAEKMATKYPLPNNYSMFTPPVVNDEIKNILSGVMTKRDNCYLEIQTQISRGLSALAKGLHEVLEERENIPKDKKSRMLEYFGDSGRIFSNLMYKITSTRRELIMPNLNKPIKEMVEKIPASEHLFGEELADKIKNIKYIERASKDLKPEQQASSSARDQVGKYIKPKRTTYSQIQARRHFQSEYQLNRKRPARLPRESRPQKGHTSRVTAQQVNRRRQGDR